MNAELDSLLGPILKEKADRSGVVVTNTDGDEPGVALTLLRYLRMVGLQTVAAGNIKGMVDHYRTPETQKGFAEKYDQDARKVTSFADATKLSMETTVLQRHRFPRRAPWNVWPRLWKRSGNREFAPGRSDAGNGSGGLLPWARCRIREPWSSFTRSPLKRAQLTYYRLGDGPFFVFYTPFHLPYIQIASTIARAAVHKDPTVAPIGGPVCEVLTIAKRDLKAGERLDGVGGFCTYG